MSFVIGLEMDCATFPDVYDCHKWINSNEDCETLVCNKKFKLKGSKALFLSDEPRRVYSWLDQLWKYSNPVIERPESGVVVIKKGVGKIWTKEDVPIPGPFWQNKLLAEKTKQDKKLDMARRRKVEKEMKRNSKEKENTKKVLNIKKKRKASEKPTGKRTNPKLKSKKDKKHKSKKQKVVKQELSSDSDSDSSSVESDTQHLEEMAQLLENSNAYNANADKRLEESAAKLIADANAVSTL